MLYILSMNLATIVRAYMLFLSAKMVVLFYKVLLLSGNLHKNRSLSAEKQYHAIKIYPNVFQDQLNYSTKSTIQAEFCMLLMHTEVYIYTWALVFFQAFATRSI